MNSPCLTQMIYFEVVITDEMVFNKNADCGCFTQTMNNSYSFWKLMIRKLLLLH